ncbi:hypothetical protein RIF29_17499 [Crotalaria pallida]|uniref:Uncharacterized protein n=1 Tax=Crotalaria pallida TaxID=3830 RepID=A0AAN9FN34_CROPI
MAAAAAAVRSWLGWSRDRIRDGREAIRYSRLPWQRRRKATSGERKESGSVTGERRFAIRDSLGSGGTTRLPGEERETSFDATSGRREREKGFVIIENHWITLLVEIYGSQAKGPPVKNTTWDHLKRLLKRLNGMPVPPVGFRLSVCLNLRSIYVW